MKLHKHLSNSLGGHLTRLNDYESDQNLIWPLQSTDGGSLSPGFGP